MSLGASYQTSKIGQTRVVAFNGSLGSQVRIALVSASGSSVRPTSFIIRTQTNDVRVRQGSSDVSITADDPGFLITTDTYWRIDVDGVTDSYLVMIGETVVAGSVEITTISNVG